MLLFHSTGTPRRLGGRTLCPRGQAPTVELSPFTELGCGALELHFVDEGVVGQHVAPFIFYQSSSRLTSSTKLLTQTSPSDPPVSFGVGPYRAELRVAPATSIAGTFHLLLRPKRPNPFPPHVQLDMSMIEMDMGAVRVSLHRSGRTYVGVSQLPMAGPWSSRLPSAGFRPPWHCGSLPTR